MANEAWREWCKGCRHINDQTPSQHCYMFRDQPEHTCAQNTVTMEQAKKDGKVLSLHQVSELDIAECVGRKNNEFQ